MFTIAVDLVFGRIVADVHVWFELCCVMWVVSYAAWYVFFLLTMKNEEKKNAKGAEVG